MAPTQSDIRWFIQGLSCKVRSEEESKFSRYWINRSSRALTTALVRLLTLSLP
jgi:hypothetical protein